MQGDIRFGRNVKILRSRKEISQQELADKIHVTRQTVSCWERGEGKPDIYCVNDICRIFKISMDEIVCGNVVKGEAVMDYEEKEVFTEAEYIKGIYAPLTNPLIGYASDDANNTTDVRRGSRNLTESKIIDGGYRFVWDFATSQANGTISAICLTNTLAGKGTQFANNYMVRLGSYSCARNVYAEEAYRNNKRIFVKEGYRLEMTTRYSSTQAVLRKYKDDFIHATAEQF